MYIYIISVILSKSNYCSLEENDECIVIPVSYQFPCKIYFAKFYLTYTVNICRIICIYNEDYNLHTHFYIYKNTVQGSG